MKYFILQKFPYILLEKLAYAFLFVKIYCIAMSIPMSKLHKIRVTYLLPNRWHFRIKNAGAITSHKHLREPLKTIYDITAPAGCENFHFYFKRIYNLRISLKHAQAFFIFFVTYIYYSVRLSPSAPSTSSPESDSSNSSVSSAPSSTPLSLTVSSGMVRYFNLPATSVIS